MPYTPQNVDDVSPYTLLRNFSKSRLLRCLFLALLIHAAVIGGLSTNYIYSTWIDPQADPPEQEEPDVVGEDNDAVEADYHPACG